MELTIKVVLADAIDIDNWRAVDLSEEEAIYAISQALLAAELKCGSKTFAAISIEKSGT